MFGTASFIWRKSTDFILEGNYIVRYMTQYFKDIGPQIMPWESTHSGVKAWIWIQSQTGCFFDGIPPFLYHFYPFAATLLFWLTVWSGQFADEPNEGGWGGGRVLDQIVKSSCKFALVRSHGDCWIWKFALALKIIEKNFHNGKKKMMETAPLGTASNFKKSRRL